MSSKKRQGLELEVESIINSMDFSKQQIPGGFAQKVIERIANESIVVSRFRDPSLWFIRSVAAAVILLIVINFYTVISIHKNNQKTVVSNELGMEEQVENISEYDSLSLLAQDY